MTNRIIKSLDCRKIISIFCILEVDFAISVITLVVIFNESFQKALVNKSICVINIVHLIVLSSTKKSIVLMFTLIGSLHSLQWDFPLLWGHIWDPLHSLQWAFCLFMRTYLSPSAISALIFFACYADIFLGPPQSLQVCFCLLWGHIWLPPHSLQLDFRLLWGHIWLPPHSLHWYFRLLCSHKYFVFLFSIL